MCKRIYSINEKRFDNLDLKSAYWIGLLYADGSCTIENKVRLWVAEYDKEILNQFRNWLNTNDRPIHEKIVDGRLYYGLEFRSWRVHNKIKKYELTTTKQKRHRLNIELLQPEIRRHFIRGIFDGDGCFYVDKRGYLFAEITGYIQLLKDVKNMLVLDKIIPDTKKIVKNGKTVFRIRLSASDTIKLGEYIYKDSEYYLRRKYNIFRNHVERLNNVKHLYAK